MYKEDMERTRSHRAWFVCIYIVTLIIFVTGSKVYAAPSSEDVEANTWYNSGGIDVVMHTNIDGEVMQDDKSTITVSRNKVPEWKKAINESYEWEFSISGSQMMSLPTNKKSTFKYYTFNDEKYERNYTNEPAGYMGYNGFALDINVSVPKGYKYMPGSCVANTNLDGYALIMIMPKSASVARSKVRTEKGKLIVHAAQMGIMSAELKRYSGNSVEYSIVPNQTTIRFDSNGGEGIMESQDVTYDSATTLRTCEFKKAGFVFKNWNTKPDGTGKVFTNRQEIQNAFPTESDITLYAQWNEIKPESISLDKTEIALKQGQNVKLTATVKPASALNKKVSFTSSDASIVTVSEDGTVIPVKAGKAVVTVRTINGMTSKCRVNVYEEIKEKGLSKIEGFTRNRVNLLAFADKNSETIKVVEKYEDLEIVGQSDNYYYVRMNIDGQYGFATKNEIEIPVVSLKSEGKEIVLQKNWQKKVMLIYIPSITTEKEVSWKSTKTSVATVTNIGVVKGKGNGTFTIVATSKMSASHLKKLGAYRKKKQPIVMSKPGKILTPKNRKWIKLRDIKNKKGQADKMEGLAGVGNTIYFVKIKKSKKGKGAKEIEQRLYSTKITTKKVAVKKGKRVIGYKKIRTTSKPIFIRKFTKLGHVNGMTATKSKGETSLFIAPCKNSKKGIVYRVDISRGKASSPKTITCQKGVGDDLHYVELNNKKIVSIAAWKYKGKIYYILKSGKMNYVCSYKNNHFFPKFTFDTRDAYVVNGNKTSYQGSTCMDSTGKYYVVYSFAYPEDCVSNEDYNKKYKGLSYIFRFNLSIKKNKRNVKQLYVESTASFMFKAGKKVSLKGDNAKKVLKNGVRKLELEDVYTYKGRMYFGSEGGDYYVDLLGRSK